MFPSHFRLDFSGELAFHAMLVRNRFIGPLFQFSAFSIPTVSLIVLITESAAFSIVSLKPIGLTPDAFYQNTDAENRIWIRLDLYQACSRRGEDFGLNSAAPMWNDYGGVGIF